MPYTNDAHFEIAATTFRCNAGHEIVTSNPDFAVLSIADGRGSAKSYDYCPFCLGEWASRKWPFMKVHQ